MRLTAICLVVGPCFAARAWAFEAFRSETVRSAEAFVESIGVNVHLSHFDAAYSNYSGVIKPRLLEAGIRHIRDGGPSQNPELRT